MEYNGRLVDGLGAAFFALGNTAVRALMALFYVAFTAVLWAYFGLAEEFAGRPVPRLSGARLRERVWLAWILIAAWPFVLIALSGRVAGESVMRMAATWNYVLPLTLLLGGLYPLLRRVVQRPVPLWVELAAIPLVFVSLLMHEVVTLLGFCIAALAVAALLHRRLWLVSASIIGVVLAGVLVKFSAPGLWSRVEKYQGGESELMMTLRAKVVSFAMSMNLTASYDFFLWALILLSLAVVAWLGWRCGNLSGVRLRWVRGLLALGAVSLLGWLIAALSFVPSYELTNSGLASAVRTMLAESVVSLIPAGLFLVSLLGVALLLPRAVLSPLAGWGIVLAGLIGVLVAYTSVPQYLGFHRSLYLTSIVALISALFALLGAMATRQAAGEVVVALGRLALPILLGVSALTSLVSVGAQLRVNHEVWAAVEDQVARVNQGLVERVVLPETLPCPQVTWYFTGVGVDSFVQQWRTYYGIPAEVVVEVVVPARVACPFS